MSTAPDVVITGLGATTPLGGDVASTWDAALAGKSGIRTLDNDWADRYEIPVRFAGTVAVPAAEVLSRWGSPPDRRPSAADAALLGEELGRQGIGLEPDPRFGGPPPTPGGNVVLFRLRGPEPTEPGDGYAASALLLQLGAAVQGATGPLTEREERRLEQHLEAALGLDEGERTRLRAHLRWVVDARPGLAGVRARIARLRRAERHSIGRFLVGVAFAEGLVDPDEVATIEKIFGLLGLRRESVYRHVNGFLAGETTLPWPVAERDAPGAPRAPAALGPGGDRGPLRVSPPTTRRPSPHAAEEEAEAGPLVLDRGRIERTLTETRAVSTLLSTIFAEEDGAAAGPATTGAEQPSSEGPAADGALVGGLDVPHSELVRALAGRPVWERGDFEELAATHRLLPDGALDRINEAAYDACDAPLLEGDDPLELDPDVLEELLARA